MKLAKKITNLKQFKKLLSKENYKDFAIILNAGFFSRKEIMLSNDGKTFYINNCIDNSEQDIKESDIMSDDVSNIGRAIKNGTFYHLEY